METIIICSTIVICFIISLSVINHKIRKTMSIERLVKNAITFIDRLQDNGTETQKFIQGMSFDIFKAFNNIQNKLNEEKVPKKEFDDSIIIIQMILQTFLLTPNSTLNEFLSDKIVEKINFIKSTIKKESEVLIDPMLDGIDSVIMLITNSDHKVSSTELAEMITKETKKHPEINKFINEVNTAAALVKTPEFAKQFNDVCYEQEDKTIAGRTKAMGMILENF